MITGTSEQPPTRRAVARWVPWVVTPLVAIIISMSLDAVDLVAPDALGGSSIRYVPPGGHRSVAVAADGVETISEHARLIGIEGAFAAPLTITGGLLARLGDEALRQAQWWRASRVSGGGDRITDLYRLSEVGITQVASWGGPVGFVFEPELLLLPASVQPGDTWDSRGSALAGGVLTYSMESVAREATGPFTDSEGREVPLTGGCIGVESTLRIENPADGFSTVLVDATVWCPGRGQVWNSGTLDGSPVGQAEVRPGALPAVAGPAGLPASWRDAVGVTSMLTTERVLELTNNDPFFGPSETSGQFWVAPVSTPDGRLVTANDRGDDVQVWSLDGDSAVLDWSGHPGGTIVSVGAVGDVVVVTTSRRQVVAYDSAGRRLWNWSADELVLAPPQPLSADSSEIVVVARSGVVSVLAAETGIPRWSRSIGADARTITVLPDRAVLVADERERLTALASTTGETLWRRDIGLVDVMAAEIEAGVVVAMTESGEAMGLELENGAERFSVVIPGIAHGITYGVGGVAVLTDERTISLEVDDGAERWRSSGGDALLGEGEVVAIVQRASIVLRSMSDGTVLDERPFEVGVASSSSAAVALGPVIVLVESDGAMKSWSVQ